VNSVAETFLNYLRDIIYNPTRAKLDLEQIPEDFRDLGQGLQYLTDCIFEAKEIAKALSQGDLDGKQPSRENELAAPLKSLQASLKHLTWQTQRIASGDYGQRVEFMGSFATNFNLMVQQLEERRKIYADERSKLSRYVNLLLDNCIDIILLFDTKEQLVLASKSYLQSSRTPDADAILGASFGSIFSSVLEQEDLQHLQNLFRTSLTDKQSSDTELEIDFGQDGTPRHYSIAMTPMLNEEASPVGVIAIFHDSTAIVQAQRAAEAAQKHAEHSNRAKSNFLARMSHEMRTPMNAIMGMTTIARTAEDKKRVEYCLDKINEASQHMLEVINDVLDMSNIETDRLKLSYNEFNFESMIKRTTDAITFQIEEQRKKFIVDCDKNIPERIITDEKRLSHVITNLLSNAVKFTPEHGEISLKATAKAREDNWCTLHFEITDTGIGIQKNQQQRLFLPFEQAEDGFSRKFAGTGLGLAIAKRLVEMMDGCIWVESELGQGASFFFEIKAQTTAQKIISGQSKTDDTSDCARNTVNFAGKRLLIAEDVEVNREIIAALLEDTGVDITFACDGAEAVEKFSTAKVPFDLVMMDIHMPEVDGYEATRRIRASGLPQADVIPIIAMTANVFQEDIANCIACGMNDHLGKPIEIDTVIATLSQYLI
jgi:signal transduction histidine kinase/ActR/RegA family two-component response regulator